MTIENKNVIDMIGYDLDGQTIKIGISDHLNWEKPDEHVNLLLQKLDAAIQFVMEGQIKETMPDYDEKKIHIVVYFAENPDNLGVELLRRVNVEVQKITNKISFSYVFNETNVNVR
jgi:hypothetical protein